MFGADEKKYMKSCRDEISLNFVKSLKKYRETLGLTVDEVTVKTGILSSTYRNYEALIKFPCVKNLIKLADFYGADISKSLNWRFVNDSENCLRYTKDLIRRYGFSNTELAEESDSCRESIRQILGGGSDGSLLLLGNILKVLEHEKQSEKFRNELLKKSINRRRKLNAKIQSKV